MRTLVLLLAVCACHKTDPNCERAVKHVIGLTTAGPPGSEPKADEQRVIDQVVQASIDRCSDEGLSEAQRDCVLAAKSLRDRSFLMCPALVAKPPSWIIAPIGHPEVLDELKQRIDAVSPPP
ncbi:MAG: hypothetical protein IPQ07_37630 [Myxococcales bacterium]|nr:hypothetical protein [Myxococcales bacterium]